MQIVNSHYVPLSAPFPFIYCRGDVAMQIGTLIVIEDLCFHPISQGNNSRKEYFQYVQSPYGMRSHSHPVVSYCNKTKAEFKRFRDVPNAMSEVIVWDNVELKDLIVLGYSEDTKIEMSVLGELVMSERYGDAYNGNKKIFNLTHVVSRLVKLGMPITIYDERVKERSLKITFIKQTPDNIFLFGVIDGYHPCLNILVRRSDDLKAMADIIIDQIDDYRSAIAPIQLQFTFDSQEEQWKPLAERLNKHYSGK